MKAPHADERDEKGGCDAGEGSGECDGSVGAGAHLATRGEHDGNSAEGLADLGGDGVGGSFAEGGEEEHGEGIGAVVGEEDAVGVAMVEEAAEDCCGDQAGDAEVGDDLCGVAAAARLGEARCGLPDSPEAGGDEGEDEEGDERREAGADGRARAVSGGNGNEKADDASREGSGGSGGLEHPGKEREGETEEQVGDDRRLAVEQATADEQHVEAGGAEQGPGSDDESFGLAPVSRLGNAGFAQPPPREGLIYNRVLSLTNFTHPPNRERYAAGAVLHSNYAQVRTSVFAARFACALWKTAAGLGVALAAAGCGNSYRPVVSSVNPVGPAGQPTKYAVAVSTNGVSSNGLVTIVDVSGDTVLDTTALGVNPQFFVLDTSGGLGYTLNGDGTLNSFGVTTGLIASNVDQTTLLPGANPISITPQGGSIYIAEAGRNMIAQLNAGLPPALHQELPTGAGTVYTVASAGAPRAYALVQGTGGGAGHAVAIETTLNTLSASIPVGINPVYGVMTADSRRAFILNNGSSSVSVINAQTNAPDTFTVNGSVASTIPVGVAPVWADFAPTLSELVVANAGNGTTPGSLTIISVPLCNTTTVTTNPNCDPANPVDAAGFGMVIATIPLGINPVMVTVLQDGTQAYVANAGNPNLPCLAPTAANPVPNCSVSVVNLTTNTVIATIPAVTSINESDSYVHGRPNWIAATTGTPTGKVYVTAGNSTDLSVLRTDIDVIQTHVALQGTGVAVRLTSP